MKEYTDYCRNQLIQNDRFLISGIGTSGEEQKHLGVNCNGFGRIRKFKRRKDSDWIDIPIPMEPFAKAMGVPVVDEIDVQVFEVAKCNLNCWWCFLPDEYRTLGGIRSNWFSPAELIDLYLESAPEVRIIDLTGGNPELVPEWCYSFMQELDKRGLSNDVYLWSDDVLTTNYAFEVLSESQISYMADYKMYGKVACFKGFSPDSFSFNTCCSHLLFERQLIAAEQYIRAGFDIYFYIALTCSDLSNIEKEIALFMDKLQRISNNLPLRIVPIKIKKFSANINRVTNPTRETSLENQFRVLDTWMGELEKRFTLEERGKRITDIVLR